MLEACEGNLKTAIVTGGAGFIGSHLVERLVADGVSVTVVDNLSTGSSENLRGTSCEFIEADVSRAGSWMQKFANIDSVFHLAGRADIVPSVENPRVYFETNVDGTFNVLEASRAAGVKRFVYAASSTCYGLAQEFPTPEDAPLRPEFPYALTKLLGENLVLHWAQLYNLPAISLRFFNVYGPRARSSGSYGALFGVLLAQKLANKPFTIVGDGEQTRDFTYVSDVVDALVTAAKSTIRSRVYNVGSGSTVSINRIVELLEGERTFIPKRPGEPDCTFAKIERIATELNWKPRVSIEEGVERMLENIQLWRSAPVWDPASISKATEAWFKHLGESTRC